MNASLRRSGRRLPKPQRQSGAFTADMLAIIRLTTIQPRLRSRGFETAKQAATEEKSNPALETALSDVLGIYHKVRWIVPTQYLWQAWRGWTVGGPKVSTTLWS